MWTSSSGAYAYTGSSAGVYYTTATSTTSYYGNPSFNLGYFRNGTGFINPDEVKQKSKKVKQEDMEEGSVALDNFLKQFERK